MKNDKEIINFLREVVALLLVQVKRQGSQVELIKELSDAGLQPKRIAEMVGTTPNTVRVAIHQHKKLSGDKKKTKHGNDKK